MTRGCRVTLALALVLAGCGTDGGTAGYTVDTQAMEPTLTAGQRVIGRSVEAGGYQPRRGDIIVLRRPEGWRGGGTLPQNDLVVRRVIAVGGERVSCCDRQGRVYVDGQALGEPYVTVNAPLSNLPDRCVSPRFDEVKVPEGHLFVMGDHRRTAQDSRCLGTVPATHVVAVIDQSRG